MLDEIEISDPIMITASKVIVNSHSDQCKEFDQIVIRIWEPNQKEMNIAAMFSTLVNNDCKFISY
jgi:hypothetical protein